MEDEKILTIDEMINKVSGLRIMNCIEYTDSYGFANVNATIKKVDDHYSIFYESYNNSFGDENLDNELIQDIYPKDENEERICKLLVKRPQYLYASLFLYKENGEVKHDLLYCCEKGDHAKACFNLIKLLIEKFMNHSGFNTESKMKKFVEAVEMDNQKAEMILNKLKNR